MTKLLEKTIQKARAFPAGDQEAVAVLSMTEEAPLELNEDAMERWPCLTIPEAHWR
jgi:hypothetical protein